MHGLVVGSLVIVVVVAVGRVRPLQDTLDLAQAVIGAAATLCGVCAAVHVRRTSTLRRAMSRQRAENQALALAAAGARTKAPPEPR